MDQSSSSSPSEVFKDQLVYSDNTAIFPHPALGFRFWEIVKGPGRELRLGATAVSYSWEPGENTAVCHNVYKNHAAPEENCLCGFNSFNDLPGDKTINDYSNSGVWGVVLITGRCRLYAHGYRSEKAQVIALYSPKDKPENRKKKEKVALNYNVPLFDNRKDLAAFCDSITVMPYDILDNDKQGIERAVDPILGSYSQNFMSLTAPRGHSSQSIPDQIKSVVDPSLSKKKRQRGYLLILVTSIIILIGLFLMTVGVVSKFSSGQADAFKDSSKELTTSIADVQSKFYKKNGRYAETMKPLFKLDPGLKEQSTILSSEGDLDIALRSQKDLASVELASSFDQNTLGMPITSDANWKIDIEDGKVGETEESDGVFKDNLTKYDYQD